MKNKFVYIIIVLALLSFFAFKTFAKKPTTSNIITPTPTETPISTALPKNADKIEILHFHVTNQCASCINLSKFTKTILAKINSNKIIFRDINIELPENLKMAADYKVSDSALYFVVTKDGKEIKEEDTAVWRYVLTETDFDKYFEKKLQYLLNP